MNYKPIIVVAGEPNSVFFEIFFKALRTEKFKSPILLIASIDILKLQMKKLKLKRKVKLLTLSELTKVKLDNRSINLINIEYTQDKPFEKLSSKSNTYINLSFELALKIIKKKLLINLLMDLFQKNFF